MQITDDEMADLARRAESSKAALARETSEQHRQAGRPASRCAPPTMFGWSDWAERAMQNGVVQSEAEAKAELRAARIAICIEARDRCWESIVGKDKNEHSLVPAGASFANPAFYGPQWCAHAPVGRFFERWCPADGNALVTGMTGDGKTVSVWARYRAEWRMLCQSDLSLHEVARRANLRFEKAAAIIQAGNAHRYGRGKAKPSLWREIENAALLTIDELTHEVPDKNQWLMTIIDNRNTRRLPTIAISGYAIDEDSFAMPGVDTSRIPDGPTVADVYGNQFVRRLVKREFGRRAEFWR